MILLHFYCTRFSSPFINAQNFTLEITILLFVNYSALIQGQRFLFRIGFNSPF